MPIAGLVTEGMEVLEPELVQTAPGGQNGRIILSLGCGEKTHRKNRMARSQDQSAETTGLAIGHAQPHSATQEFQVTVEIGLGMAKHGELR